MFKNFFKRANDEDIFETVDPIVEQRRNEKFSKPLIYDEEFKKEFLKEYPQVTKETLTHAIGEYEKTLITPNSDFDRYLKGDKTALTEQQVRGYELFKQHKCDTCHTGVAMGLSLIHI